jgi:hypothetical protein
LAAVWLGSVLACCFPDDKKSEAKSADGPAAEGDTIPYEVLRKEKRRGDNKLAIDVLVSETASRPEVMKLAEQLRREYDGKFATICIWDSREAWRKHPAMLKASLEGKTGKDMPYDEKELDRHWLVVISGYLGQEIRWVAEGRDDPKASTSKQHSDADKADGKLAGPDRRQPGSVVPPDKGRAEQPAKSGKADMDHAAAEAKRKAVYVQICAALEGVETAAVQKFGRKPRPDDTAGFTIPYKAFVDRETLRVRKLLATELGLREQEIDAIKSAGDKAGWPRK